MQEAEKAVDITSYNVHDNHFFTILKWHHYDISSSHSSETDETRSVEFDEHSCEEGDDENQGDSTDPELPYFLE